MPQPITILAYGFRPFFLLAGLYGVLSMAFWLLVLAGGPDVSPTIAPELWHGHEMLFGFAAAAVSGFLLTSVPSWTNSPPATGPWLALPVVLWIAGRAAMWLAGVLPPVVTAVADLSLIPVLFLMVGPRILGCGQRRNYIFLVLLGVLFAANLLFHLEALGVSGDTARSGLKLAVYGYILMLSVVAGRIIPFFTANTLKQQGEDVEIRPNPVLEILALVVMAAYMASDLAEVAESIRGGLAFATLPILLLRMANWRTAKTLGIPILWIIHLGYLWLPVGFASLGAAHLGAAVPITMGLHALTTGAVGTIVMAVMTRAGLGHTGRPLVVPWPIVGAYLLVTLAALFRTAAPLSDAGYDILIIAAAGAWSAAYGVFTVVYWPLLTRPRIDGKPG